MTASRIRRIAAVAIAAAGLTAVAAPMASADSISVSTTVSVPSPYPASAYSPGSKTVFEGQGPIMLKVRHKITCLNGNVYRKGYAPYCQWNSSIRGTTATLSTVQGQGDVYPVATPTYPTLGTTFHAGTVSQGRSVYDDWTIVVRDDNIREATEQFKMNVRSLDRTFTIVDND